MLRLDLASPEPLFAQLRTQITAQVADGTLQRGARLPTVRRLAGDLDIAPNTVARAYRELEADGLIIGRGRAGTFVTGRGARERPSEAALTAAQQAAATYARTVRSLDLTPGEALILARQALQV